MTVKNPDDSVRKEQFDAENHSAEINKENDMADEKPEHRDADAAGVPEESRDATAAAEAPGDTDAAPAGVAEEKKDDAAGVPEEKMDTDAPGEALEKNGADIAGAATENREDVSAREPEELPDVDYSGRNRQELVETLELLIENRPLNEITDDVDKIKTIFYKKLKAGLDEKKKKFMQEGGKIEEFQPADDPLEHKMKNLLARFRGKKTEYNKQLELKKQENLKKKYEIIDKIKELVYREESINKTFQEFRELQSQWHSTGLVPQSSLRNLWETYNLNVEIFYDYIKINKELRDLDFKKNLEIKIKLCEKAETLLTDPVPIKAFRILQEYHQQWRETGPVPRELRSELWDRFKDATAKINKRHHEYFEKQKEDQKKNLEAKTALCEKVEAINELSLKNFREWEKKAREVIDIQKQWRNIGFAPRKHNNNIYQRFREACDVFFQAKREFYAENKEHQMANLQKKTALCEQAEVWQDSTEWKEATDALINFQKEWKASGSVPRKYSDKIWKRFRKACDHFFERKAKHFAELDNSFEDNLKEKERLIKEIENFDPAKDSSSAFEKLREIQKRWNEVGFVPYKDKDAIVNRYREALNMQFDKLKIDEEEKVILKYQTRLENIKETPRATRKLRVDREKFIGRIKQLENDIVIWENNIGFFSKSSNAESMIREVQSKIDNARKTLEILEEKVRLIDRSGIDD